jgi:tyrosine-specific transport protein
MKSFIFATAVLISTIVGVGMFGLPYSGAQSGFLIAAVFLFILTGITLLLHLLYSEIVSRTKEKHRLVGYAGHYLGKWGRRVVSFSVIIGLYGSLLVYIIVGGDFLYTIFHPLINLPPIIFNLIFFVAGTIAVYFGIKLIAELDLIMSLFLILIVFLFLYFGFPHIDFNNLKGINFKSFFFPYGAILYALAGIAAIPEIREIFTQSKKLYKRAIIVGTLIPAILYLIFMGVIIGLTGLNTSPEAIQGLSGLLGKKIIFLGALFGFLATITSFFILGLSLKKTFSYDFKINKNLAWVLTCFIPLIFFILGLREFILIIVILGALMGGIEGTAIVLISKRAQIKIPDFWRYAVIIILVLGFIFTLISLIKQ